jgi:glycosyltransferase involved in cell wall biosynthesis
MARILIDLSQFSSYPAHTGVQRVLCELLSHWPAEALSADIGVQCAGEYRVLPLEQTAAFLQRLFKEIPADGGRQDLKAAVDSFVSSQTERRLSFEDLQVSYEGYFLPEPTFRSEILSVLSQWQDNRNANVFVLLYDILPQTHPEVYGAPHQLFTSRYFRLVARSQNVACISVATRHQLEHRLRRCPAPNSIALDLGADSLAPHPLRQEAMRPTFVMVGTVEPRKRHEVVLQAFDRLWDAGRDYRLIVFGGAGWCEPEFLSSLRSRSGRDHRFTWHESASDKDIAQEMRKASAAIYISELEGYGLPAVEALAAGCPLIAAANLPALAGLDPKGQIRLPVVNADTVAAAVEKVADGSTRRRLSIEASDLQLPTWERFARDLTDWIDATLRANGEPQQKIRGTS